VATYNHFYELPVYKTCRDFRKDVTAMVRLKFPKEEKFLLSAQVLDSVRSITANIAEGFGRYHHQENIQFCRQARGSLAETMEHLIMAFDEGFLDQPELESLNKKYRLGLKELNTYVKYLKAAKAGSNQ
jgi:four helix bundle protein